MKYLQQVVDLANDRGYLELPEVITIQKRLPDWFKHQGLDANSLNGPTQLPAALKEFYQCQSLACFLEGAMDASVFLTHLEPFMSGPFPPVVKWTSGEHVVVAYHGHSGMVCAARLGLDDPPVFWGFSEEQEPSDDTTDGVETPSFSKWIFDFVSGYENLLDHWEKTYREVHANPAELKRVGGMEWIRDLPGMTRRL